MQEYIRVNATVRETQELDNNVFRSLQSIYKNPLLNSPVLVKNVVLGTSDTLVNHGLNRPFVGYIIVGLNANSVIYTSSTVNKSPLVQAILKASNAVTANILFF